MNRVGRKPLDGSNGFYSIPQAAKKLGITVPAVRAALRNGHLPNTRTTPMGWHEIPAASVEQYGKTLAERKSAA